nr:hypothetical protein BaRGS_032560 [Batillaria attramentaria]
MTVVLAKEMIEQKKMEKMQKAAEEERQKEIERRKLGQDVQQLKKVQHERELQEVRDQLKKEKEEERKARERVKEQIERDRAERQARFHKEKAEREQQMEEAKRAKLLEQQRQPRRPRLAGEIRNITLRFPETAVPNTETNYFCMTFDLPSDAPYHLVATKPYIDNAQVMHHILLFTGTNPELRADFTDSSGLTVFYTPRLRPYNAATFMLGQRVIKIPPGQPSVVVTGTCSSSCSIYVVQKPIYVQAVLNHMHYLGKLSDCMDD